MSKERADWEDTLKVLVHQTVLNHRKNACDGCPKKGDNKFCQVNLEYLPEFQKYKYNACPNEHWKENW